MKIHKILITLCAILALTTSCKQATRNEALNYMTTKNVVKVADFPIEKTLKDGQKVDLGAIGIKSVKIKDSILMLTTKSSKHFLSFYSLPEHHLLGRFLNLGEGPFEFIFQPEEHEINLVHHADHLEAFIYDFHRGKILKMDVSQSIKNQELAIAPFVDSIPSLLFNLVMVDKHTFLYKQLADADTRQVRTLVKDKAKIALPVLERLNRATLKREEDFNLLSTITKYNQNYKRVVEMPMGLNYLNIYALDGSFERTIYWEEKISNLADIQGVTEWKRRYIFTDLQMFPQFFGVVCIDETGKYFETGRQSLPVIYFFDLEGNPLAKLHLNEFITSFDIDFTHHKLYTFDLLTEEFKQYEVADILQMINEKRKG